MSRKTIALHVSAVRCLAIVIVIPCPCQAQELTWEQLGESGFGNSNTRVAGMTVLGGLLCAGTDNKTDYCQVWAAVPEPSSLTLMLVLGSGLGVHLALRRSAS